MSGIYGVLCWQAPPPVPEHLAAMDARVAFRGPDDAGMRIAGPAGLGGRLLRTTPESVHEHFPLEDAEAGLILVADARIDNREELIAALGLRAVYGRATTDGELILAAYRRWGEDCAEHLLGDFAFALWDAKAGKLFCARDHFGARPFCYFKGDSCFVFASSAAAILAYPEVPRRLNESYLSDFLCGVFEDTENTGFADIFRLPPAHTLMIDRAGRLRLRRYWRVDPERELAPAPDEEYIEGFRAHLRRAVHRRLRSLTPVASELSGGLDSSLIAATAQGILRPQGKTLKTFTHARPKAGVPYGIEDLAKAPHRTDERPLADLTVDWCGLAAHTYVTGEDAPSVVDGMRWELDRHGYPSTAGPYGWLAVPLMRSVAASGAKVLLSGQGGDQCATFVSGRGYYADLFRRGDFKILWREAKALDGASPWRALIRSMFFREFFPGLLHDFGRIVRGRPDPRCLDYQKQTISRAFAARSGADAKFAASRTRYVLHDPVRGLSFKDHQVLEIEWGYTVNALEHRSLAAMEQGIELRFPLLDKDLVEYVLAVPAHMKLRGGWRRYLARRGAEGLIPPEIQWHTTKRGPATIPYFTTAIRHGMAEMTTLAASARECALAAAYIDTRMLAEQVDRMAAVLDREELFPHRHVLAGIMALLLIQDAFGNGQVKGAVALDGIKCQ